MSWIATMLPAGSDGMVESIPQATRYDLVLAAIPAAFLLAALFASTPAVPEPAAFGAASVVGVLAVVDALFLNPPQGPSAGSHPR